jgi:hypothetical protein
VALELPSRFSPTHNTMGLPGFRAVDVFAPAGTLVRAGSYGEVIRLSGRPATGTERPGGAYGLSVYWKNSVTGVTRYATHFASVCVDVGDRVGPMTAIGRVARAPAGSPAGSDHVHLASTRP